MRTVARNLPPSALAALALILASVTLPSCSKKGGSSDLEAINVLHQRDMEASKKWDIDTLASLWTDDVVTLSEGEPPLIGKAANRASVTRLRDESRELQIIDYNISFNEVKIVGDWAFEWGTYSGTVKPVRGELERNTGKVIRVLKRDSDGFWKIARAMYNSDSEPG